MYYSCNFSQTDMIILFPDTAPPDLQKNLNILKNYVAISLRHMDNKGIPR